MHRHIYYIVCMFSENRNPPSEFAFNSIPVDIVSWIITDIYIYYIYVRLPLNLFNSAIQKQPWKLFKHVFWSNSICIYFYTFRFIESIIFILLYRSLFWFWKHFALNSAGNIRNYAEKFRTSSQSLFSKIYRGSLSHNRCC